MKVRRLGFWLIVLTTILNFATSQAKTDKPINLIDSERFNQNIRLHTTFANKDMSPELIPLSSKMLSALYSVKKQQHQFSARERALLNSIDLVSPEGSKHFHVVTSERANTTLNELCKRLKEQIKSENIDIFELTTLAELAELQEEEDRQAYLEDIFLRFSISSQEILAREVKKAEKSISHSDTDFVSLGQSEPEIVFMLYKQGCETKALKKQHNFNQADRLKGLTQEETSK